MTRSPSELPRMMSEGFGNDGGWTREWIEDWSARLDSEYRFVNPMLREKRVRAGFVELRDILAHSKPITDAERYRINRDWRWLLEGPVPDKELDTVKGGA